MEHVSAEQDLEPEQRLDALRQAMYDVYDFDPLILVNMFHLQSSETLKNLSPELLSEIRDLSRSSLEAMAKIFEEGIREGYLVQRPPGMLSAIVWALFSGIVLWEENQRIIEGDENVLKETFDAAFQIFQRGIVKQVDSEEVSAA
jgi:hypothetical protein